MEYSIFTSYGQLEYSSELPDAEKIYASMAASYTHPVTGLPIVDLTPGSYHEAKVYARAMAIADGAASTRRAGNQQDPLKATESLPHFEADLRIAPKPNASIESRRAAVAARKFVSRGSRRESIYDGLTQILGAALIAVRPIANDEATKWPAIPALGPGVFARNDTPAKTVRLVDPVTKLGSAISVTYQNWDTDLPPVQLFVGDVLCVQPENLELAEKVIVSGVSGSGATRTLTATFTKAHDQGASATTGPTPIWASDAGHLLIVVTALAALSAELCGRVNDLLTRLAKGGTTWSIVEPTTPGASTVGPFTLDSSPLGAVPVGQLPIVHIDPPVLGPCVPAFGPVGGGTLVTLYGRNFTGLMDVSVDGISVAFTFVSDFKLTFTTAAHAHGAASIAVITAGFTVAPFKFGFGLSILSISPTFGPNGGGTFVTLRGAGFLTAIGVTLNGFPLSGGFHIVDDNTITCTTDSLGGPGSYVFQVDDGVSPATSPAFTAF